MSTHFNSDPGIRRYRLKSLLRSLGRGWTRRSVYVERIELDISEATILNKITGLLGDGYIESRRYPMNPRLAQYRITRKGAEWMRDNRVD